MTLKFELPTKNENGLQIMQRHNMSQTDAYEYFKEIIFAWHDDMFGEVEVLEPLGVTSQQYLDIFDNQIQIPSLYQVNSLVASKS
jgi:hypothetical protein